MRVVIAGGGTGGHLFPGLAVARALKARVPDAQISFAGTAAGIEARVIPSTEFELDVIRSAGLKGKSPLAIARGAALVPLSGLDAWRVISRRRPDVVIGVGGYSSGPVVAIAALRGIPSMLLEQNAVPGLTNKLLAPLVKRAAVTYDASLKFFGGKGFVSGNPVRQEFLEIDDAAIDARKVRVLSFWRLSGGARNQRGRGGGGTAAGGRSRNPRSRLPNGRARLRHGSRGLRAERRARPRGTVHRCDGPRDESRGAGRFARGRDDARGSDRGGAAGDSDSAADGDRRSPAPQRVGAEA